MDDLSALQIWIAEQAERQNLSWREVSLGAGLNPGAVSSIMTGTRPGLQICVALAHHFGVRAEFVLRLAGHLPPAPPDIVSEEVHQKLQGLAEQFEMLPPELHLDFADTLLALAMIAAQSFYLGKNGHKSARTLYQESGE